MTTTTTETRRPARRYFSRHTTATHTLIIPAGALLTEPGGKATIWRQERRQSTEAWQQSDGRFLVVLDGRTYYVDASEVRGVVAVD